MLAGTSLVEAAAIHLVLVARHPIAAWIVTAASAGGAAWCGATARSLAGHPLLVRPDGLLLRAGSLWTVEIPANAIVEVRPPKRRPDRRVSGYVGLVLFGAPTVIVKTSRPIAARGPAGLTRAGTIFGVAPDDAEGFVAAARLTYAGLQNIVAASDGTLRRHP